MRSDSQSWIESFYGNAQKPPDEGSVADSVSKDVGYLLKGNLSIAWEKLL